MISSLWLIEGVPWPARKKYPAHSEAVRAFEGELTGSRSPDSAPLTHAQRRSDERLVNLHLNG